MAFRELRSFTETMRTLGYPRVISMENFRTPNFPLVADILYWLVKRFDPSAKISDDIDTENQRVLFLTAVASVMASKARLQLRTKNLYAADGRAVKELLKVARLMLSAVRACQTSMTSGEDDIAGAEALTFSVKPGELSRLRTSASDITEAGARLHDLLGREAEVGPVRTRAVRLLDSVSNDGRSEQEVLERAIRSSLAGAKDSVSSCMRASRELEEDEVALVAKLAKKKAELERNSKRLESLQSVRPAFMDEYEKLEREVASEYDVYVARFRNLTYLQGELARHAAKEAAAAEKAERALKRLQRKLKDEETKLHRGDDGEGEGGGTPDGSSRRPPGTAGGGRPQGPTTAGRAPSKGGVGAVGAMGLQGVTPSVRGPSRGSMGGLDGPRQAQVQAGAGRPASGARAGPVQGRPGAVVRGRMDADDASSIISDESGGGGSVGTDDDADF